MLETVSSKTSLNKGFHVIDFNMSYFENSTEEFYSHKTLYVLI
jgi:hypothetical protein